MSITAFILIFCSIFLHVGWNYICKTTSRPSISFYMVANFISFVVLLPFLFLAKIDWSVPGFRFWSLVVISGVFEVIYACSLYKAYGYNDISLVYPMARALPVIFIPVITMAFSIGTHPTMLALAGMLIVAAGCIILPQTSLNQFKFGVFLNKSILPIFTAAIGTTGYTIIDKLATSQLLPANSSSDFMAAGAYLCIEQFAIAASLACVLLAKRSENISVTMQCFKMPSAYVCGTFSCWAYLLVLCAMPFVTNISYLQAFRQMSLPLAVAAGILILKEKLTPAKIYGTALIVTGLIMTVM